MMLNFIAIVENNIYLRSDIEPEHSDGVIEGYSIGLLVFEQVIVRFVH